MPVFSIVIPAFRHPELLRTALNSCLSQDFQDYEILVSDDSPGEEVAECVRTFESPKIRLFRHPATGNPVDNWNFGLSKAEGEFVIVMHHDESFGTDSHLSQCLRLFQGGGADVCFFPVRVSFPDGREREMKVPVVLKKLQCRFAPWSLAELNLIGPTACAAFRRKNSVPFDSGLRWIVDVEWYLRLMNGRKVVFGSGSFLRSIHGHADQLTGGICPKEQMRRDLDYLLAVPGKKFLTRVQLLGMRTADPLKYKLSGLSAAVWRKR